LNKPEIKLENISELKEKYLKYCEIEKQSSTKRTIKTGLKVFEEFSKGKKLTLDSFNQKLYDDYKEFLLFKRSIHITPLETK